MYAQSTNVAMLSQKPPPGFLFNTIRKTTNCVVQGENECHEKLIDKSSQRSIVSKKVFLIPPSFTLPQKIFFVFRELLLLQKNHQVTSLRGGIPTKQSSENSSESDCLFTIYSFTYLLFTKIKNYVYEKKCVY